ncbi:MND1-interacting protein 1 [Heracleum sosnowskyi]|uniref:MND1-interacting protein 1 n=1 Tax=Heracleum sosnowskyi TaxID=360622 RepID=A0AAD8M0V6_9APIA|nr:MND1-interacting protein 1 [Heracleum sosnowskyi]
MGQNGRGKKKRSNGRPRSRRAFHDVGNAGEFRVNQPVGGQTLAYPSGGSFNNWSDNSSEKELETQMYMNLQFVFNEAVTRLCRLGFDEKVASDAILKNGHCYGQKDVLSNMLDNTSKFLMTGKSDENRPAAFVNLQHYMDVSLGGMVFGVQRANPRLSRRDAMLCLCRASNPHFPERFHYNLLVNDLLKGNVTECTKGFTANSKSLKTQETGCSDGASLLKGDSSAGFRSGTEALVDQNELLKDAKSQDVVSSLLDIFREHDLDESIKYVALDEKDEMILGLIQQVRDLDKQVKEMEDWVQKRVTQAKTKVCNDIIELHMLRSEREETERLKKGKQTLEDFSMAKLWSMQHALSEMDLNWRKAVDQHGRINALKRKLEIEHAETIAELEASKLSASEFVSNCAEVAEREKKSFKRLLALEKQKTKLHNETAAVEEQISQLETQLVQLEATQKDAQTKQREVQKAKESSLAQLEEERRLLKATESANKRKHASLNLKIETDVQHHKDELERLELELSRLKVSSEARANPEEIVINGGSTDERMSGELNNQEDSSSDRNCFICVRKEVSVVLLPCAHQALQE